MEMKDALTLMISFATLIVMILAFPKKIDLGASPPRSVVCDWSRFFVRSRRCSRHLRFVPVRRFSAEFHLKLGPLYQKE
ncbi:putative holin-like toxin [Paenibacillus sp. CC-CFT747]|nr:putative holin-like toxin [Paenibacillus sp. CC-CFT747]